MHLSLCPLLQNSAASGSQIFQLSPSSPCAWHPITAAAYPPHPAFGLELRLSMSRFRPASLPPNTTQRFNSAGMPRPQESQPPHFRAIPLTRPQEQPPSIPGLPSTSSCFYSQVQGTLASIQMHLVLCFILPANTLPDSWVSNQ